METGKGENTEDFIDSGLPSFGLRFPVSLFYIYFLGRSSKISSTSPLESFVVLAIS